jgi:hypothetical protein
MVVPCVPRFEQLQALLLVALLVLGVVACDEDLDIERHPVVVCDELTPDIDMALEQDLEGMGQVVNEALALIQGIIALPDEDRDEELGVEPDLSVMRTIERDGRFIQYEVYIEGQKDALEELRNRLITEGQPITVQDLSGLGRESPQIIPQIIYIGIAKTSEGQTSQLRFHHPSELGRLRPASLELAVEDGQACRPVVLSIGPEGNTVIPEGADAAGVILEQIGSDVFTG